MLDADKKLMELAESDTGSMADIGDLVRALPKALRRIEALRDEMQEHVTYNGCRACARTLVADARAAEEMLK